MTEFDIYMQLGNQLEKENKLLMAYGMYMEAFYSATEEEQGLLKSFLELLEEKVSVTAEERNQELKLQLLEWIAAGEISCAISCYSNIIDKLDGFQWIDAENAVLYQCFSIYQSELNNNDMTWSMGGKSLKEIKEWYLKLRFMIRRIDMNASDDVEFISYVTEEKISKTALYYMGLKTGFYKKRIFSYLCNVFKEYQRKEYEQFFYEISREYPEENTEITEECEENNNLEGKIAFILAVNDEMFYQEALYYIQRLKVPPKMEVEVIPIRGANAMTEAYQQGMEMTDAKYKVYLHQDAMLVNSNMIYELCHIFKEKEIGMVGVAGAARMSESGIWWNGKPEEVYMNLYQDAVMVTEYSLKNSFSQQYKEVEALDGVLLATQYDLPWRCDLFQGWHFYDVSQCMEFKKNNYKVVVAGQKKTWCVHMGNYNVSLPKEYMQEKEKFLKEY